MQEILDNKKLRLKFEPYKNKKFLFFITEINIRNTMIPLFASLGAKKIAFMKREEIFPEKWKVYIDKINADLKFQLEENKSIKTDQFKCGKCKQNECSYYALQIRSCDEPETLFITCLNCKNKWKQEG